MEEEGGREGEEGRGRILLLRMLLLEEGWWEGRI